MSALDLTPILPFLHGRESAVVQRAATLASAGSEVTCKKLSLQLGIKLRHVQQVVQALRLLLVLDREARELRFIVDLQPALERLQERRAILLAGQFSCRNRSQPVDNLGTFPTPPHKNDHGVIVKNDHGVIVKNDHGVIVFPPAPPSEATTTPLDRVRVRSGSEKEEEVKPSFPEARGPAGATQPSGGEGSLPGETAATLAELVAIGCELWPGWQPAPQARYLEPLLALGASSEQIGRYLRDTAKELAERAATGKCRPIDCQPRYAGSVANCAAWLKRDSARRAKRAQRAQAAWGNVLAPPVPPPADLTRTLDGCPAWDAPASAAMAPRRAYQVRVPIAGPPPAPYGPPGARQFTAAESDIYRQFREAGVDPYAGRQREVARPDEPFTDVLRRIETAEP